MEILDENNSYLVEPLKSDKTYLTISPYYFEYFIPTFYVNKIIHNPQIFTGNAADEFNGISKGRCIKSKYKGWYEIKFYENDAAIPLNVNFYNSDNYVFFKKDGKNIWPEVRWISKYYIDDTFRSNKPIVSEICYYVIVVKNKEKQYKILYVSYDNENNRTSIEKYTEFLEKIPRWFLEQFKKNNNKFRLEENDNIEDNLKLILYNLGDTYNIIMEKLYEPKFIIIQALYRGYITRKKSLILRLDPNNLFNKTFGNKRRKLFDLNKTYSNMKKN